MDEEQETFRGWPLILLPPYFYELAAAKGIDMRPFRKTEPIPLMKEDHARRIPHAD